MLSQAARGNSAICYQGPHMPGTVASIQIMLERNPGVHLVWASMAGGNCDGCTLGQLSAAGPSKPFSRPALCGAHS